jgi:molecular chaperone GrpE (heat shock protein)
MFQYYIVEINEGGFMSDIVSVAKLQSQIDKVAEAMTETEMGRKLWEEIQRKQKEENMIKANSMIDLLKKDIDKNIERLQTCQGILNTLKIKTFEEMTDYRFNKLEELINDLQATLEMNDVAIKDLEYDLQHYIRGR